MEEGATKVLRVDAATVVIFSILFSPFLIGGVVSLWRDQIRDGIILCGLYVALLYWMCGRTVELVPGRLVYRVFFARKEIDVSNVVGASVVARPAPTLELRHAGSNRDVPAFIVKPFTKAGVAAILRHIRESSPRVKLDRIAEDMSEGRFDSITRETVKAMNLLRLALALAGALVAAAVVRLMLR